MVVDLVHAALEQRGGAVRVDRDAYKNIHPHYAALLSKDVRTAGVRVRPETYRWQAEVEARVRAGRYDAVVEAPLAHPQEFLAGIAAYRQAGYRVELVALAVPEAVSQLGILDRYLRLAQEGRARYVSWDNHDQCAAALVETLSMVEAAHLADRVFVVRRSTSEAVQPREASLDHPAVGTQSGAVPCSTAGNGRHDAASADLVSVDVVVVATVGEKRVGFAARSSYPAVYVARRVAEGKTSRDAQRCLKRAICRQLFKILEHSSRGSDLPQAA